MTIDQAKNIVKETIASVLENEVKLADEMHLIGGDSLLDSMKLVEVCLALEDLADDEDFEFDWRSASAMSKSRSMFRTIQSLAEEFANQSEA